VHIAAQLYLNLLWEIKYSLCYQKDKKNAAHVYSQLLGQMIDVAASHVVFPFLTPDKVPAMKASIQFRTRKRHQL
jgi:hypothetical protein